MMYSSRLKKIMTMLIEHDGYCKIEDITDALDISKRTVYRELKYVQPILDMYQLTLISKQGYGYCIEGASASKNTCLKDLHQQSDMKDREERQTLLTLELLQTKEVEKLSYYATMFQVSEATISKDLDQIEQKLATYHIRLERKTGKMITVIAQEVNKRKAITELIKKDMYEHAVAHNEMYPFTQSYHDTSIFKMLDQEILGKVLYILQTYYDELHLERYAQNSYQSLIIHLVIMITRILNNEQLTYHDNIYKIIKDDVSFIQAKQLCLYVQEVFQIHIPTIEVAFLALHIKGAKINRVEIKNLDYFEKEALILLIEQFIQQYEEDIQFWLKQDQEFMDGLFVHLQPTLIRLQYQLPIQNPLSKQIQEEYAHLFDMTKHASIVIEQFVQCQMNDDEIAFLTMHVGASLERKKRNNQSMIPYKVGIVCTSGIGASALLLAKIKKVFGPRLHLQTLTMQELTKEHTKAYDFLISTVPLKISYIQSIQVSPILFKKDIENIEAMLKTVQNKKKSYSTNVQQDFYKHLLVLQERIQMVMSLLHHIHFTKIQASTNHEAIQEIMQSISLSKKEQEDAVDALKKREALGSLIMKEDQFIMYHALVPNLQNPHICITYPKGSYFLYAQEIKFIITLLLPKQATQIQKDLFSNVSKAIIEKPWFYDALFHQNEEVVRNELITICKEYINSI